MELLLAIGLLAIGLLAAVVVGVLLLRSRKPATRQKSPGNNTVTDFWPLALFAASSDPDRANSASDGGRRDGDHREGGYRESGYREGGHYDGGFDGGGGDS